MSTNYLGNIIEEAEKSREKFKRAVELAMQSPEDTKVGTTPHDVIYTENKLKLLHYRPTVKTKSKTPLILIFALVNRPYILDLKPGRSVVEALLNSGIDVYLIDWGVPGDEDKHQDLDYYTNRYIKQVVKHVKKDSGANKVNILGYCMGGTMSAIYTALHPDDVKNLILLTAGIDYKIDGTLSLWSNEENFNVDKFIDAYGNVPPEFLQSGFLFMKPVQNLVSKYVNFYENVDNESFVDNFMAMEKWLNDNIAVPGEIFREFVKYLYQENQLAEGKLQVAGTKVDLKNISCPVLNLIAEHDHLVPPASSLPLNDLVSSKDTKTVVFPTGHIGMSVSSKSLKGLWPDVAEWLLERD
mgnify:CR=1 FL=1